MRRNERGSGETGKTHAAQIEETTTKTKFLPFEQARRFARSLGIKSERKWRKWCKSGIKPENIPYHAYRTYKKEWKGWGDWLGTDTKAAKDRKYLPFPEAREYVRSLGFKNKGEYQNWIKFGKRPENIPSPDRTYKKEWKDWSDWLGTEPWPFAKARKYVRTLGFKSKEEYWRWHKSGKRPGYIPYHPDRTYKKEWKDWSDWLNTDIIATQNKEFLPFEEARKIIHSFGLKNVDEWEKWRKSEKRPKDIPTSPNVVYKNEWKGLPDWLGYDRKYRSFEEAREFTHSLHFDKYVQWREYCKSGKKPRDIPSKPDAVYNEWKGWKNWLGTEFVSFEEARKIIHSFGLKSRDEWDKYRKSENLGANIPSRPAAVYKEWQSWGDWLGTGTIASQKREYRSFEEARRFVHGLNLKNQEEWFKWCKSGGKPPDIPSQPQRVYKQDWKGMGDWLGTRYIALQDRKYRPFEEARRSVHELGLKSREEWNKWCKSGQKPDNIPSYPNEAYKKEWQSWGDWLGTGTIAGQNRIYRTFEEAREFVHKLNLNQREWRHYIKSGMEPSDIPKYPEVVYKKEWKGTGDWLGTGRTREFLSFEEARQFVHSLGLKSREEWKKWCKFRKKPKSIPTYPNEISSYKKYWKGWVDWLGTGTIANRDKNKDYWPFKEAREFVHSLGLKSREEWNRYCKSGKKPKDIPSNPNSAYKQDWKGWPDFLGHDYIATQNRSYRSFPKAKEFVHSLGFKKQEEYLKWCKSGKKPKDIPSHPEMIYEKDWKGIADFLGYEETRWSIRKVKELLKDWIESGMIYDEDEIVLYHLLSTKGLLNLRGQHGQFFKKLIEARCTPEGRKAIEEYVHSDSEIPPGLSEEEDEEIGIASSQEIANLVENESKDPLDYGKIKTVEQIFAHCDRLESYTEDIESMQFYVNKSTKDLWSNAFRDEKNAVSEVRNEGKNGNRYHDTIQKTFLSDYEGAQSIEPPKGYAFMDKDKNILEPTLMQRFVAYKVKANRRFGNFSGTGTGKTLSAVLASRVINSKMTLIVCPNDVVDQWENNILEIFPDSVVITKKEAFDEKYDESKYKYLVLNYDLFSQSYSPNLILDLVKQKIDFVVLDEIHFTKKREDNRESKRRHNIEGLMTEVSKKNSDVYALGLSATPVINELEEGKSLLQLITGKMYDDISTRPTPQNAVKLYEKLSLISIREIPLYPPPHREDIDVEVDTRGSNISIKELKRNPLTVERLASDAKIPKIIEHIEGPTIIYTEYVTGIVEKLRKAVEDAGYTYAIYTGEDHSGLKRFLDKKVQVLIASRPISTGVDGLQHICNNLIINTLPWTNAQYQQLVGRLVRKGSKMDSVNVYIIKANINGFEYDDNKWKRILYKRTLADCAVDGRLPEKNMVTPHQAMMEAVRWLERLERGEISRINRRDLDVKLTPVEIERQQVNLSEFSKLNNIINTSKSETIHAKIKQDPQFLVQYHERLDEARKFWSVEPVNVIADKINGLKIPAYIIMKMVIGDFGCGRARLAELLKENKMYNFEHHNILNEKIIACDMKKTPLKNEKLDIAVFCLSLMGENWSDYITEAKRCLRTKGMLMIAETTKSLSGRLSNLRDEIKKQGFDIYSEEERGDFTFIEASKL